MVGGRVRGVGRLAAATLVVAIVGCGGPEPRSLAELVVRDSLYVDPVTDLPYSGPVYRAFPNAPETDGHADDSETAGQADGSETAGQADGSETAGSETGDFDRRDLERVELEGRLLDGTWHGELRVYHPNGRIRYMGNFEQGQRCGPWTENADSVSTGSLYDEVVREVETMGLYPPCEGARGGRVR